MSPAHQGVDLLLQLHFSFEYPLVAQLLRRSRGLPPVLGGIGLHPTAQWWIAIGGSGEATLII
jgi:hypothetical protein